MCGNFPNAEEAQDVVNAVSRKVFRHFAKAALPPSVVVRRHNVPVVSGEAPVLTVGREGVGRCSRLSVHIEVMGFYPRLNAATVNANGDVALENDALRLGIATHIAELDVKQVLQEAIERHIGIVLRQTLHLFLIVNGIVLPVAEVGSIVLITQVREGGIRHEPMGILAHKFGVILGSGKDFALGVKKLTQVAALLRVYLYVIHLCQGIKGVKAVPICRFRLLIVESTQLTQVNIHGMEGIDGNAVVGVRVKRRMRCRSVVDGQNLQDALLRLQAPIDHCSQIAKVAYALTALTSEREHGDSRTCHADSR